MPEIRSACPFYDDRDPRVSTPYGLALRDCPCARLLDPWNAADLPDAVCWPVLRATVRRWAGEWWRRLGWTLAPTWGTKGFRLVPDTPDAEAIEDLREEALDRLGRLAEASTLLTAWPMLWEGRPLAWALRQWVQEEPSATLAAQLAGDAGWRALVEGLRRARAAHPAAFEDPRHDPDFWLWEVEDPADLVPPLEGRWPALAPSLPEDVGEDLRRRGLPATPATVGYAYAAAADGDDGALPLPVRRLILRDDAGRPLPARGLLVTSLHFVGTEWERGGPRPTAEGTRGVLTNPEVVITGDLELATGPLLERVQAAALRHRDFGRVWGRHAITEVGAVRQAQPTSFRRTLDPGDDPLDYEREALRDADAWVNGVLRPLAEKPLRRDDAIKRRLDRVYKRVKARRARAGHPAGAPKGWRERASRDLIERLNP